eukprot:CAMPEP_0119003636 /NCGR_PEP_ID=MMETSP1176-20130426/681_1 /TAXON_ID=265551 /ORGANISM="Synedropsis recta cf, Strain CCMP1620" /LENGTH=132 /DNA_ID=CAMNT_0006955253 /DNA_START=51 /DNA_END=449 /DNA_ORIENTATION=-
MRDSTITANPNSLTDFTSSGPSRTRRVCFTEYVEVNEYEPLNPELKSSLYYSREEMHAIHRRVKAAISFLKRYKKLVAQKLVIELQESTAFQDYLHQHHSTAAVGENQKRAPEEEGQDSSISVPGSKRRRTV